MNTRTAVATAFALAAVLAGPAALAEAVDETRPAAADARIDFKGVTGDFEIVGHDAERMQLTGTLGEDVEALRIDGDEDHWRIELEMKKDVNWKRNRSLSDLVLRVPAGARLDVGVVSGDLMLRDLSGASVESQSVSGDIELASVEPTELRVQTVSGDIEADSGGSEVNRLQSVSGDISIRGSSGRLESESVSGDIELDASDISDFRVETVSGDIDARLRLAPRARLAVTSHSGDIDLHLPGDSLRRMEAETFSGEIENAFGGRVESGMGPGQRLRMDDGPGSADLEATTFSGTLRLRRLD